MKRSNKYRWVSLLLMIGAVSAVLTAILEDITGTDQGFPGLLFKLWFFCNTFGMLGLFIFYSSSGSKWAGWTNLLGLAVFYIVSNTGEAVLGFGLGFGLFGVAAAISREMPGWWLVLPHLQTSPSPKLASCPISTRGFWD